jgi:hypothetical protein
MRERFVYYPHDVWLFLLASCWQRIGQEEHLMPRAGYVGDELGSALMGSRLIRDVINLCFLMEKQYGPYPKWFGTAFQQLQCAERLQPVLWRAQLASTWQGRAAALTQAFEFLARFHNALKITEELPVAVSPFFDRPFQVIHGEKFAQAIVQQITDLDIQHIASHRLIGNIDQISDNTDFHGFDRASIRKLYD